MLKNLFFIIVIGLPFYVSGQPDFYNLGVQSQNVKYTCYINGFPVHIHNESAGKAAVTLPVQLFLIGSGNILTVEAQAIDPEKAAKLYCNIIPYNKGELANAHSSLHSIAEMDIDVSTQNTTRSISFDNEGYDYSYIFSGGAELTEAEVCRYGEELYGYLKNSDVESFVGQMDHMIRDYSLIIDVSEQEIQNAVKEQLTALLAKTGFGALQKHRISAQGYSNNKIWEILLDRGVFLNISEGEEQIQMPVFVAKINGRINIVR